ncbi:MAG: divalent-cation tolerance protein CutA [Dehalococcoidia bacterium]|jgi:periplasmic divalent cation tolerance protein
MKQQIQVTTTTSSREEAERIAEALVEARLAACVQIVGPIASVYRWKGTVERATEWLCIVKTERRLYAEVEAAIKRLHSYEVPEVLATEVVEASEAYLNWLQEELAGPEDGADDS